MKKTLLLCSAWTSGYMIHAAYPYIKAISIPSDEHESHSFQDEVHSSMYSQPKIIDLLHNSPEKHFLHNLIVQDENAFNYFKVFLPKDVQNGNYTDSHHLHIVFNAAEELQGNNNDIHSGLLATIIDNAFGQLSFVATGFIPTATANLQINCNQPIHTNKDYLITCEVEKIEGRKVFLKAQVFDEDRIVCSTATALFISVNWGGKKWKQTIDTLQSTRLFSEGMQKLLY